MNTADMVVTIDGKAGVTIAGIWVARLLYRLGMRRLAIHMVDWSVSQFKYRVGNSGKWQKLGLTIDWTKEALD